MAETDSGNGRGCLNNPIFLAVGVIASLLAVTTFFTGKDTIWDFFTSQGISGNWEGTMSQQMPDGSVVNYGYTMDLTQTENSVQGTARINFPEPYQAYYAVHKVRGAEESEDKYSIDDGQIVEGAVPPGTYWCEKSLELHYNSAADRLEGSWSQSGCGSGEIALQRQ